MLLITDSLVKLRYIEGTGTVICRSKMSHGGNKHNFQAFTPLEFIVAISRHIPERLAQMMRYYGWYSNRMRGDRQRAALLQGESEKTEAESNGVIIINNFRTKKIRLWLGVSASKKSGKWIRYFAAIVVV